MNTNTIVWVARIFGLIVVLVCIGVLMSLHGKLSKMSPNPPGPNSPATSSAPPR